MDESLGTCNKRFEALGIPQTQEYRRKYRQLIITAPQLEESISGAILFDETVYQKTEDGVSFLSLLEHKGIIAGIKVDQGAVPLAAFPDEKITEGLDGLRQRLEVYYALGIRFAKWRAVIKIDEGIPTKTCIKANSLTLALYAALCQEIGLVPIVEPEVLMDGEHTLEQCAKVTQDVLNEVFNELFEHRVCLEGMILKPNMVVPGLKCKEQCKVEDIAEATISCFLKVIPAAIGGVAFLSGGQSYQLASERLNIMHLRFGQVMPWPLAFSFSRAIQQPALEIWKGENRNIAAAQKMLVHRASCNSAARRAEYSQALESI